MGWAIAIHAGAGTIQRSLPVQSKREIKDALAVALKHGMGVLATGGSALDAVEQAVRMLEDDPHFNAGRGAVLTRTGEHELDASIMDGRTRACGSIGGARTARNPITVARAVMEKTPHVLLVGRGADEFVDEVGADRADARWFTTARRKEQWQRFREATPDGLSRSEDDEGNPPDAGDAKGTVGAVAVDRDGNVAAATSTGGLTNKMPGRVGDTGCIGAGTYADNRGAAVSCTGHGEEFQRAVAAHALNARMMWCGEDVETAGRFVVEQLLPAAAGGLIAVDARGRVAMPYSSEGMYRGCADERGRFEVHIWEAVGRGVDPDET